MSDDTLSLAGAEAADVDKLVRSYLTAGANAVRSTTKALERKLEQATQSAVPGRLWRAWKSEAFPRRGAAKAPAGTVFINGGARTRGALMFWSQPGAVRGSYGQYLAIPLPSAGPRGRKRDLTPGEWEKANGQRLIFLYRQGKPSLLVATKGTTGAGGRFRKLSGGSRGRIAKGRGGSNPLESSVVPIFVLLPMVAFRNTFAVEPIVAASEAELVQAFFAEVRGVG